MRRVHRVNWAIPLVAIALLAPARAAVASPAAAGPAALALPALGDSLRLDPAVRTGTLANGLRYYIRHNGRPAARVCLRLVVAAGSNLEADDQRGFAHLCEHMNFDGSAHFKPEELAAYLQSVGLRFGADANAYTGFDQTVYMLDVPTDRDTLLDRGLVALSDFAGRATFPDSQLTKERKVVLEEWRLGRGAGERIQRQQLPAIYFGSRYAERLPIGLPEVVERGSAQRLRDYYRTFYTPDRMAVVAVGDIEPARMDSLIRVHFSDLVSPPGQPVPSDFAVPIHPQTLVVIASDKEATSSSVGVLYKHPRPPSFTVGDWRRDLVEGLFSGMLNARFSEIARRADPPFLGAGGGSSGLNRHVGDFSLGAGVADGGVVRGLAALLDEVARVRRYGFLPSELERAKESQLKWNESAWAERDKSESEMYVGAYVGSFLSGEPSPGIEVTHTLVPALLAGITVDEVNALVPRLVHDEGRVVLVTTPEKPGLTAPTETALRAVLARPVPADLAAWEDHTAGRTLMPRLPRPGRVTARRTIAPLGVTVLTLSNGVEVWLKPTDFKADDITIGAYALGGTSLADSADYVTASMAERIVNESGFGGFTSVELQKLLAGRIAMVSTGAGPYTEGAYGSTRPADLETSLQLMHLAFTMPTRDTVAFAAMRKRLHARLADRANSPEAAYSDTVSAVNSGDFYMYRPTTDADVDRVDLDRALDMHRHRFANAADFTFFMVGSFQPDSVVPLLERYLGSLPSAGKRTAAYVPRGPRYPTGVRAVRVRRGVEPKSSTQITFFFNGPLEELDLYRGQVCASILTERLRVSLREMLGGTYGASASFSAISPLPGYQTMVISFGCDPTRLDSMIAATLAEVRTLRDDGPTRADLEKEQEIERRELEVALKENTFWSGSLQAAHLLGRDPLRILERRGRIDALTLEDLRATCRKYLPLDRYTVISLLPEAATGAK